MDPLPLLEQHRSYLSRIARAGEIAPQLEQTAWNMLLQMLEVVGEGFDIPDTIGGPNGTLFYTWTKGPHYLELEMFPDGRAEYFYRNEHSGHLWTRDGRLGGALPSEVPRKLGLFRRG